MRTAGVMMALAGVVWISACSTEPKQESAKQEVSNDIQDAMSHFKAQDPTLQALLDKSYGYAVFPDVGKAGLGIGGSYGHGELFDQRGAMLGYASISQATIGLQAGAQQFSELLVFTTSDALERFKSEQLSFSANMSAAAAKAGAAASSRPREGVSVFVHSKGGLMAEAAIGGQQFHYQPSTQYSSSNP